MNFLSLSAIRYVYDLFAFNLKRGWLDIIKYFPSFQPILVVKAVKAKIDIAPKVYVLFKNLKEQEIAFDKNAGEKAKTFWI